MRRFAFVLIGLVLAWNVTVLVVSSHVNHSIIDAMSLLLFGSPLAVGWLVLLALVLVAHFRRRAPRSETAPVAAALVAALAVTGATVGLASRKIPFRVRFRLSESALTAVATGARPAGRAGLFTIRSVEFDGKAAFLDAGPTGLLDHGGFAYSPDGPPPYHGESTFTRIRGPWYQWTQSW